MKTTEEYIRVLKRINHNIEVVGSYTKAHEPIDVRCLKCCHTWSPKAYSLTQGRGCPVCAERTRPNRTNGRTKKKTQDQFVEQLLSVNPELIVIGNYNNTHEKISVRCNRCGHTFDARPYSLLQGHGCPRCAKSGTSFMEQLILLSFQKFLGKDAVVSRDKKTIGMELDIYIPNMKLAIEPGGWLLHRNRIERDIEKREKCIAKGIRLITIYDKFPDTQEKIFKKDAFYFSEDLNKANHEIIRGLIYTLFDLAQIDNRLNESEWQEIEKQAYSRAKAMTTREFINRMKEMHPTLTVKGEYRNSGKQIEIVCKTCGRTWQGIPSNLLAGDGCKKCGVQNAHKKFIRNEDEFKDDVAAANENVEIIGPYVGRHQPIRCRCKICGFEWNPRASSLLRGSNHKGAIAMHKKYAFNQQENR